MKKDLLSEEVVTRPDRFHRMMLLRHFWLLIGGIAVGLCLRGFSLHAAILPEGFTETQVGSNVGSSPTAMEFAPDGRLFVCLQGGQLRVIENEVLLATPFVTLTVDSNGERGLLGVAFDPNFASNQFVYVYYTVPTVPIHNRVSRFTANGNVAEPGSEAVILELDNLSGATNHNGGGTHFGPDGKLYIGVGENANSSNSQSLENLLGKMLRINADGTIPTDNPFFNQTTGNNRAIWALGLRNPYTSAFQPGTGRMFINDVGQSTWEEIDDGIAGSNYGWPNCEGPCSPPDPNFRDPLFQYGHGTSETTGCAIVGGAFYNPSLNQFPASYVGKYFFADLCSGWIRLMDPSNNTASAFAAEISTPVDLHVGSEGALYYLAQGNGGQVFKIQYTATPTPTPTPTPAATPTPTPGQPPAAPTNLLATAFSSSQIALSWTDKSNNETGFQIQRSNNGVSFALIATVGANVSTYTNNGLTAATTYYYRVRAFNSFGHSAVSNIASATTLPASTPTPTATPTPTPGRPPAAPTNLSATAISSSRIALSWTDNSNNEGGFQIQRSNNGVNFTLIATVGANVTTYRDNGLTAGTTYYYRVRAFNSSGNSAASNVASATTPP